MVLYTGSAAYGVAFDFKGNVAWLSSILFRWSSWSCCIGGYSIGYNQFVDDVYGLEGYGFNVGLAAARELIGPGFGVELNLTVPSKEGDFELKNVPKFLQEVLDPEGDFGGGATASFGGTIGEVYMLKVVILIFLGQSIFLKSMTS
jgi:hypothetical protein